MKIHIESKHENIKYPCNECDARLGTIKSLHSHMENIYSEKKNVYKCDLCENEYVTKPGLKKHVLSRHEGSSLLID